MLAIKRLLPSNPEKLGRFSVPVTIILIVMLANSLAKISWNLLLPPSLNIPLTVDDSLRSASKASSAEDSADYEAVADWHLFGEVIKAQPKPPPAPTEAPETQLNLNLVGIFFSDDNSLALALIAAGDDTSVRGYRVGDTLPGGARLEQVHTHRIVLLRNGRLENLSLPRQPAFTSASTEVQPNVLPTDSTEIVNAVTAAEEIRERIAKRTLGELVQTRPYVKNGEFMGFRLLPGFDSQLFEELGLESGDVITQINGVSLTDPQQSMSVVQDILNADQVVVQVLRQGTEIPFTFVLRSNP